MATCGRAQYGRSKVRIRIRGVASPMGRRYIQFSDGVLQSRLALRVLSVTDIDI